jgi:olfactory receptor
MIADIQTHNRVISYVDCLTQMSLCIIFANMDDMLLTVMAYDRFVAICHPLHYPVTMNSHFCCVLVLMSFMFSLLDSQLHNLIALQFTCFKDVEISNYFCDPSQILNLSCSETLKNSMVRYFLLSVFGFVPFSGILFSYYKIVSSILRMPSSSGKWRKPSPPVGLTCQWFAYFMEQPLVCTLLQLYHVVQAMLWWPH